MFLLWKTTLGLKIMFRHMEMRRRRERISQITHSKGNRTDFRKYREKLVNISNGMSG